MAWQPIGKGLTTEIDWSDLRVREVMDPYLVWFDMTKFAGALPTEVVIPIPPIDVRLLRVPLIFETSKPFGKEVLETIHAHKIALSVPQRYLDDRPYHVTGHVLVGSLYALQTFVERGCENGLIVRFELALPLLQLDRFQILDQDFAADDPAVSAQPLAPHDVVAFVDYGCAFAHRKLRWRIDGRCTAKTRVFALWDQNDRAQLVRGPRALKPADPDFKRLYWARPQPFQYGMETVAGRHDQQTVDLDGYVAYWDARAVPDEAACYAASDYEEVQTAVTHGTFIMDVATGYPNPLPPSIKSKVDPEPSTDIVFVQLPRLLRGKQIAGLLRANVLDALRYIASCTDPARNVVANVSYGYYCGPHDGTSIIEQAIDELIASRNTPAGGRMHVVIPTGNSCDLQLHAKFLLPTFGAETLLWNNAPEDPSDSFVEIWLPAHAKVRVRVTPSGQATSHWVEPGRAAEFLRGAPSAEWPVCVIVNAPRVAQGTRGTMILLAAGPTRRAGGHRESSPFGEWRIELENRGPDAIVVEAWSERDDPVFGGEGGPRQAYFSNHIERTGTLNCLAHGYKTIVVGGYVADFPLRPVAEYSGTGPGRGLPGRDRHPPRGSVPALRAPEVLAPADESSGAPGIAAAAVYGDDTVRLSGTSVACAFTTRYIVESGFVWPGPIPGGSRTPAKAPERSSWAPPIDEHPDDEEEIPRIP